MSVRDLPIGFYGAVMGLAGLALSARAAAPVFPGVVRAPAYFTEPWALLGGPYTLRSMLGRRSPNAWRQSTRARDRSN